MKTNSWEDWLRCWVRRHPVGEPPQELQREYGRQVMERIRAKSSPRVALLPVWVLRPRPAFALAGALAAGLAVLLVIHAPAHVARQAEQESQLLFEVGGVTAASDADLEQELQEQDRIVLAEATELR